MKGLHLFHLVIKLSKCLFRCEKNQNLHSFLILNHNCHPLTYSLLLDFAYTLIGLGGLCYVHHIINEKKSLASGFFIA